MAEDLADVRTELVNNLSREIINQLLDNLMHKDNRVINPGERDSIIEGNNITSDRARQLIDSVIKKGDKACNLLISHLAKCDPKLHESLPLPLPPAPSVKYATQESQVQENSVSRHKQDKGDRYDVTPNSMKNRVALLITNITFEDPLKNRDGAEKDEENMEELLTKHGYEVVKHTDLTGKKMDEALVQFSKHPKLKETDSVFVVIMSHGKRGAVSGVDGDELPIDNIYKHLNTENCPALVDKPKIIMIQACRGEHRGAVVVHDDHNPDVEVDSPSAVGGDIEEDIIRFLHKEKDFTALLSCTPDTLSYRQTSKGSFLIQFTVEVFNEFAQTCHIEDLFQKIMKRFEDSPCKLKQMPTKERCTTTRNFYFYPRVES